MQWLISGSNFVVRLTFSCCSTNGNVSCKTILCAFASNFEERIELCEFLISDFFKILRFCIHFLIYCRISTFLSIFTSKLFWLISALVLALKMKFWCKFTVIFEMVKIVITATNTRRNVVVFYDCNCRSDSMWCSKSQDFEDYDNYHRRILRHLCRVTEL